MHTFQQQFEQRQMAHLWPAVEPYIKSSIIINHTQCPEEDIPIGASKIGGRPDLPPDMDWPIDTGTGLSLSFLAQINCSEVEVYDIENLLPKTGMFYFFYDQTQTAWGYWPVRRDSFRLRYIEGNQQNLERRALPDDLQKESRFMPCSLAFEQQYGLPEYDLIENIIPNENRLDYQQISGNEGFKATPITKLLGHSNNMQWIMEMDCEAQYSNIESEPNLTFEQMREKYDGYLDWQLLFQLDSIYPIGMLWGDMGKLYFWIKKNDLASCDFDKAWVILQC